MFQDLLFSSGLREFAAVLDLVGERTQDTTGVRGVLYKADFDPVEFACWLSKIVVAVSEDGGPPVYRIYGEDAAMLVGRNLRGRPITEWPRDVSDEIQTQFSWVRENRRPAVIRYLGNRFSRNIPGQIEERAVPCEKIMVPVIWLGGDDIDGFLSITSEINPEDIDSARAGFAAFGAANCQCIPTKPRCNCTLFGGR